MEMSQRQHVETQQPVRRRCGLTRFDVPRPRRFRVSALQCFLLVLLLTWAGGCGPIWYIDAGFAQRLAKQENKPLLMYFKAWDSTQHRNMKLNVFEYPPIKKQLVNTVNLELEFAWFPDYAKRYGVQRPQVCVMCTPEGKKIHPSLYVNPVPTKEAFLDWLLKAKAEALPEPTSAPAKTKPRANKTGQDKRKPVPPSH